MGDKIIISGIKALQKDFEDLEKVIDLIDGSLTNVHLDTDDPESVSVAISKMEKAIDDKVGHYKNNEMVASAVKEIKEKFRNEILEMFESMKLEDKK